MAQKQEKLMSQAQVDQAMVAKLTTNGFSKDEAQKILALAKPLSRGQRVTIPPNVDDAAVRQTAKILNSVLNNPKDAKMILATELGPRPSHPPVLAEVPTLVRPPRYAYEVNLVGKDGKSQTYTVELTTRLPAGFATSPEGTQAGKLNALIRDHPELVYAIKTPDGKTICREKIQDAGTAQQKLVKADAEMNKYINDQFRPAYSIFFARYLRDPTDEAVAVRFQSRIREGG